MKIKRIISLIITLILISSIMTGCGKDEVPVVDQAKDPIVTEPVTEAEPELEPEIEQEVDAASAEIIMDTTMKYLNSIPENYNMISALEVATLREENPDALLIVDIRQKYDYDLGHIAGAMNIPFEDIGKNLDRLPTNRKVAVVCYTGQTSAQAVVAFRLLGVDALSYQGGMNFGWKTLELAESTLEKIDNPLPEPKTVQLSKEDQIIWDEIVKYFDEGKSFVDTAKTLNEIISDKNTDVFVLDVRRAEDFALGHMESSVNIPFREVGMNMSKLPKDKPIYMTCYSGQTASQILMVLRLNGYTTFSISRGMNGWNEANLPVVVE